MTMNKMLDDRLGDIQRQLVEEFGSVVSVDAVLRVARDTAEKFRDARVSDFVPLFVERATRVQLLEMSRSVSAG